jgi:hypothetical protein
MLSNEEKSSVVDNKIKNLEYAKYNLELSLIEENAVEDINQSSIDSIEEQMSDVNLKITALEAEKSKLTR